MSELQTWAVLGLGVSGSWQIDLLEAGTEPNAWLLTIASPSVDLIIDVSGPSIAQELLDYFERTIGKRELSEFVAGKCLDHPLVIAKDDEFPDRYFVRISGPTTSCIFTLGGEHIEHLQDALRQIVADLAAP